MRNRFLVGMTLMGLTLSLIGCGGSGGGDGGASSDGPPPGGFTAPGAPGGEEAPKEAPTKKGR